MKCFAFASALVACTIMTSSVAADGAESASWGYKHNDSSMASPEQWSEHYPTCGGSKQSPINIEVSAGCNAETRSLTFSGECTDYNLTQSDESFKASVNGGASLNVLLAASTLD
jgi:carbonic anhydrase